MQIKRKRSVDWFITAPSGIFLWLVSLILISCFSSEQKLEDPEPNKPGFFSAINADSIIRIGLSFDLDSLKKDLESEHRIDGQLKLDPKTIVPIKLSGRGVTRKKICDFPPLHLHFSDSTLARMGWGPYKKYKVVTHCQADHKMDAVLLKEYLIYQLYHLLTPYSFRVQLCEIQYETKTDNFRQRAFIIEEDDEMAERMGGELIKKDDDKVSQINKEAYQHLVLFQYMIGNTDWNIGIQHNIKFLQLKDGKQPIPVPYDFDFSGLVNASYATPYPSLPIKNVRERFWQYRGTSSDDLSASVKLFLEKKEIFLSSIQQFKLISESEKQDIYDYVLTFYNEIESMPPSQAIRDR